MANTVVNIVAIQRIEVITGSGGRRFYTAEEKIRLVHEAGGGRGSVAAVARRHAICTSLIYRWRRQMENGDLVDEVPHLVPVRVLEASVPVDATPSTSAPIATPEPCRTDRRAGLVEVVLANGRTLRVAEDIAPAVLRRLVGVLEAG
jgi:transposase